MSDFTVTKRTVRMEPARDGYMASVIGYDHTEATDHYVPRQSLGNYAFARVDRHFADRVRGDLPDVGGTVVIHIGSHFGKHYWRSHDDKTVPVDVLEALHDRDLTLVRNVGGGWADWGGRPEFSESYIDFTEAEVVDMDAEIADRRAEPGKA